MSKWAEIRCDYYCEEDNFWRVDAWLTDDGDEEGKVIAYIDNDTTKVIYHDPLARTDEYAQEVIQDMIREIKAVKEEV